MALQNEKAKKIIEASGESVNMDTLFYLENGRLYTRWSALLKITKKMNLYFKTIGLIAHLVPTFIGNRIYNKIAKRRKKIKGESCYLPLPDEKDLFLQ